MGRFDAASMRGARASALRLLDGALLILYYAVLVVLFTRPSVMKFTTPVGHISLTSAKNITLLFCALWILSAVAGGRRRFRTSGMEGPLLAFLAAAALSAALSPYGSSAERWSAVAEFLLYAVFFHASLSMLRGRVRARTIALVLFTAAVAVAAIDLAVHYRRGIWVIMDQDYPLWDGKNALGLYMVFALSLGVSLLAPSGGAAARGRPRVRAALVLPGLFLLFLCLVYSYSRGAWVAAVGAALVFGALRNWKWIILMLAALVILCFMPHRKAFRRLASIPRMADGNVVKREAVWRSAAAMIRTNPVLGVGPGEFRTAYDSLRAPRRRPSGAAPAKEHLRYREHAHNLFLQVAAECGMAGLAAVVWGIVVLLRSARRRLRAAGSRAIVTSALAALGAFLAYSMVDCSWTGRFSGSSFMHINLIVALLAALVIAGDAAGGAGVEEGAPVTPARRGPGAE